MSTSEATVKLTAHAEDESTLISVLDPNLNLVPDSTRLGETVVNVPPGAYSVRFQIGNDYVERIAILDGSKKEELVSLSDTDAPRFVTSAPVRHTRSAEFHRGPAQDLSLSPPWTVPTHDASAKKGNLLLFARDIQQRDSDPTFGLTLHSLDGDQLVNFSDVGSRSKSGRWAGAHVALAAGAYRLRLAGDRRHFVEQIVYIAKDWQTQIFLLADGLGDRPRDRSVNPATASVLMARPGDGFNPERPDLRWTESALRALRGSGNIPGSVRTDMMWEKFQNPMLGLYAGLLHTRRQHIDPFLLRQVFHNLLGLIGPCPDVLAIGWALALYDEGTRHDKLFMQSLERPGDLSTPPMLRASWNLLVQASVVNPNIFPAGSFSERASLRLLASEPWFSWRGDPPATPFVAPRAAIVPSLAKIFVLPILNVAGLITLSLALPYLRKLLKKMPTATARLSTSRFTDVERRVAQYVDPMLDPQLRTLIDNYHALTEEAIKGLEEQSTDPADLVRSLGIPAGTALSVVWALVRKLLVQPVIPTQVLLPGFVSSESHTNSVLESTLTGLNAIPTSLRDKPANQPVHALAFLVLYYRGSPAAADDLYKGRTLVEILNATEYVCGDAPASDSDLASILDEIRRSVMETLERHVAEKKVAFKRGWKSRVLPPREKYKRGELLPAPHEEVAPPASSASKNKNKYQEIAAKASKAGAKVRRTKAAKRKRK
jgi:hypothetical protein